jgi:hypothetical protein
MHLQVRAARLGARSSPARWPLSFFMHSQWVCASVFIHLYVQDEVPDELEEEEPDADKAEE